MEKKAIVLAAFLLSGCTSLAYDTNEMLLLSEIWSESQQINCKSPDGSAMAIKAEQFRFFVNHAADEKTQQLAAEIESMVKEFADRKGMSTRYCELKIQNIQEAVGITAGVLGQKERK